MDLRQLNYFVAVAEELNFSRAAARVHISQPALSRQVMSLERELGVKMLVRSSHAVQLTAAGLELLDNAHQLLSLARDIPAAVQRVAKGEVGRLRVGFVGSTIFTSVPALIGEFRRNFPMVAVDLKQATVARQINLLNLGDIDVGIVRQSINESKLQTRQLFQESFFVALPVEHRLTNRSSIFLKQLADESFVTFSRSEAPNIDAQLRRMCGSCGFVPHVVQEAHPLSTVVGLVAAGVGIAIVPNSMRQVQIKGVTYRELKGTRERSAFLLAWRRNDQSPALVNFLETARNVSL